MKSPCISKCSVHMCGICDGCGRTVVEIEYWSVMTDYQQKKVIALIPARAEKFGVRLVEKAPA